MGLVKSLQSSLSAMEEQKIEFRRIYRRAERTNRQIERYRIEIFECPRQIIKIIVAIIQQNDQIENILIVNCFIKIHTRYMHNSNFEM